MMSAAAQRRNDDDDERKDAIKIRRRTPTMQEQESPTLMEHGFLWRNNLQRSILCVPSSIDKTLRSRFWFSTLISVY